jgi:superfamily I DNA/RNA helicase
VAFDPTPEQQAAIAAAKTGENLVITAGAGSGKTSTLRLIADALAPKRGIYIAYNKAIATDAAKSFPSNVTCRTAHSFAFRAVGFEYKAKLNARRMTGRQLAVALDIEQSFPLGDGKELAPQRLASLVMQTVNGWCHTADPKIEAKHAPVWDVPGCEEVSYDLAQFLAIHAQAAWDGDLVLRDRGRLPFSHDMYVKVWALSGPTLPGDFILYDEAQDADPCIAGIVLAQKPAQLIAVGDESQAIYGWRGATDAMKNWPATQRVSLTKSFRFGQAVADQANRFLDRLNAPLRIEGFEKINSQTGMIDLVDADAVLCRTNASVIETALAIHYARKFSVVGGTDAIRKFAEAAQSLMQGRRASWHPDLGAFAKWGDVVDYVNNDSGGSDIRSMVNIVENFGVETIFEVADKAVSEGTPGALTITTAHKAKGREWGKVVIASDFTPQADEETGEMREPGRAELMLMYVAVTRAKTHLDAAALAWAA